MSIKKHLLKEIIQSGATLFYFKPDSYGDEFFVIESSKESALKAVKKYILNEIDESDRKYYSEWLKADINNLPDNSTIIEKKFGEVIRSEIS